MAQQLAVGMAQGDDNNATDSIIEKPSYYSTATFAINISIFDRNLVIFSLSKLILIIYFIFLSCKNIVTKHLIHARAILDL